MRERYADIIIDISHEKVDRPFQYRIPSELEGQVTIGLRVTIPFGNGNGLRKGYVVGLSDTPKLDKERIKEIAGIEAGSTSVQSQLIQLAWWMRKTYGATMNQTLKTVLPVKEKIRPQEKRAIRSLLDAPALCAAMEEARRRNWKARLRLFEALKEGSAIPIEVAQSQLHLTQAALKPLVDKGQIEILRREVKRSAFHVTEEKKGSVLLNEEQQEAVRRVCQDYDQRIRGTYLLYGITGSGKTEVYMELISHVLAEGKQVILLIPEISLTYQTVMRFYSRFGDEIAVLHSKLSKGERYEQWERAARGEVSVMIGPRSALFAPFERLGLIIIDEEHEGAYKSETMPRYHAREVAERRAADSGASLVLGSATPSLESYTKALSGQYTLLRLTHRAVKDSALPSVETVDLRKELLEGNKSIFSRRLQELIEDRLAKKEQIMLFMNRRGYSNFISCRSCGEAVRCPHCDVSLTLHGRNQLVCHYCGYRIPLMTHCPTCGSPYLAGFGAGTQKLEELTRAAFPGAGVLRMDADTTAKKGGHEAILAAFSAQEADILIGTQMIVKGHDFGNVTLVGILAADLSLNAPDFRCAERTFQLLTQAAGRAGRGKKAGNVVIQTYQPDHYAISTAAAQDYEAFYRQEIAYRRMLNYPPVSRMQAILFAAASEALLCACTESVMEDLRKLWGSDKPLQMIGPVNAPVYKVNDIYRKILYIKSENCDILDKIRDFIEVRTAGNERFQSVLIQYDIS